MVFETNGRSLQLAEKPMQMTAVRRFDFLGESQPHHLL
jgi:hypothetical protein